MKTYREYTFGNPIFWVIYAVLSLLLFFDGFVYTGYMSILIIDVIGTGIGVLIFECGVFFICFMMYKYLFRRKK